MNKKSLNNLIALNQASRTEIPEIFYPFFVNIYLYTYLCKI